MSHKPLVGRVIAAFTLKRIRRGALIIGVVFGIAVTSQTLGLVKAYPSAQERGAVIHSLGSNIGLQVIFGSNKHLVNTVGSYATWRVLGALAIMGSIWALLISTRALRGEEEQGRWELLISGPVSQRRATLYTLGGLYAGLLLTGVITALILTLSGQSQGVNLSAGASTAYALTLLMGPALFMAVGAVTSQLAGTRQQATMLGVGFLAACFMLRAIGNLVSGAGWLRAINPFCWIDNVLPFTDQQFIWFVPMLLLVVLLLGLAVLLSGQRDLSASHIRQRQATPAHLRLLKHQFGLSLRLSRVQSLSWLAGLTLLAGMFGFLAKTAASAFEVSGSLTQALGKITQQAAETNSMKIFLGLAFFMLCVFTMLLISGTVNAIRNEEAQGTLETIAVQPVSRIRWLAGRLAIVIGLIVLAGGISGLVTGIALSLQHSAIPFGDFLRGGLNIMAPALFVAGCGLAAFGWQPRLTSAVLYGVISWSFLLEILGSILNLNHWLLDTSLLHHLAAVPAVAPVWQTSINMAACGLLLMAVGAWRFVRRDLQNE